jgi:fatty-acid desaturase
MNAARVMTLAAALVPYLALVSVDTWMHEKSRRVPRLEQVFHAKAAVLFVAFVAAVFLGSPLALPLLIVFVCCAATDEIGFHRHLLASERRVHFMSYAALMLFVCTWRVVG